jgi:hypothetical protein
MRFLRFLPIVFLFVGHSLLLYAQDVTPEATPQLVSDCAILPEATPAAEVESTETPAPDSTPEVTLEPTVVGEQDLDAPIHFETFVSTDVNFNPDKENPVVVVIVFSLIFQNQLNEAIDVRAPKFQLAMDGVSWGDIASTDFQMGQLLANATHGIVLQSLTFVNNTTDEQKQVLDCIENERPVDLTLTGTIEVYVDGEQQTINVNVTSPDVIIQARKPQN